MSLRVHMYCYTPFEPFLFFSPYLPAFLLLPPWSVGEFIPTRFRSLLSLLHFLIKFRISCNKAAFS